MLLVDPRNLDITSLPSLPFDQRHALPNIAAVYFVLDAEGVVLYIGRAKSLCFRWQAHHRLTQFSTLHGVRLAWLTFTDASLLPDIEKALIAYFQPFFNAHCSHGERVTLHLKTERVTRDKLLGALRARGITMQEFFDRLMQALVEHPAYLDEIDGMISGDDRAHGSSP